MSKNKKQTNTKAQKKSLKIPIIIAVCVLIAGGIALYFILGNKSGNKDGGKSSEPVDYGVAAEDADGVLRDYVQDG